MTKTEYMAKSRRLNFLGYKLLTGHQTLEEDTEARRLLEELDKEECPIKGKHGGHQ